MFVSPCDVNCLAASQHVFVVFMNNVIMINSPPASQNSRQRTGAGFLVLPPRSSVKKLAGSTLTAFRIFSHLTILVMSSISLSHRSRAALSTGVNFFTATHSSVFLFFHKNMCPKVPAPSFRSRYLRKKGRKTF